MQRLYFVCLGWMLMLLMPACSSTAPSLFSKQSVYEQYGKKLIDAGLKETALGRQWFAAGEAALQRPTAITIPYKELGYFSAEKPRAVGFRFTAKRGEKLTVQLTKKASSAFILYGDVWKAGAKPVLQTTFDTTMLVYEFEASENGAYIVRLQPELLSGGEYTIAISASASLGFPVAGKSARIASIWGDARDAGARQHEGIDIFAPKRTPAIAAADGTITAVNENKLGGKTIWLRPRGADYVLYYAHLDEQLVQSLQHVKKGDTVGLVGNTGNARTTPAHLHFGVYASGGAIDPLPFVNPVIKKPEEPASKLFQKSIRLHTPVTALVADEKILLKAQTVVTPVAITATTYRVLLPDGNFSIVPIKNTQNAATPVRMIRLKDSTFLLEQPQSGAARKKQVAPATPVSLIGYFNDFALLQTTDGEQGWVFEKVLQ